METKINIVAVPENMRYEKYANVLAESFAETFTLGDEGFNIFLMEMIYFYRSKSEERNNNFKNCTLFDFYNYFHQLDFSESPRLYKKIDFFLSLLVGEDEESSERIYIGHPIENNVLASDTKVFGPKTYDDYLCSPKYLDWVNNYIKAIQKRLAQLYKK